MATALMVFCVGQVRADPGDQDQAVINLYIDLGLTQSADSRVCLAGNLVADNPGHGEDVDEIAQCRRAR
jgi:hypothetical protein